MQRLRRLDLFIGTLVRLNYISVADTVRPLKGQQN